MYKMLYERIVALCGQNGVRIADICRATGIRQSIFTDLKAGRTKSLASHNLQKIADYFDVTVDYLLTGATSEDAPAEKTLEDIKKEITEVRHFDGEPLTEADIRLFNDALDMAWELVQKRKKSRSEKNADSKPST